MKIALGVLLVGFLVGCAGHAVVARDGNATGGNVTVGDVKGEVNLNKNQK